MKRLCVVTSTRAEYGLLYPLIKRISEDPELKLELIATGAHLSKKQGYTVEDIKKDGFDIAHEIPILDNDNSPYGISITMSDALKAFAKCFRDDRPDMVIILGDRTEMLPIACAAANERIPVAHIHGGEVTEGAVDDCIRHAISKMSYLHFTAAEEYRGRVIRLGEAPERVFNVGALGTENILTQELISGEDLRTDIGIPSGTEYAVVTFHPVTLEDDTIEHEIRELCAAMDLYEDLFFFITGANADAGGDRVNEILRQYSAGRSNAIFVQNLGMKRYLSAVRYASFVLGNSSSGILEAPVLGTPTVNIGNRQKGRLMAETVICCEPSCVSITEAINRALDMPRKQSYLLGDGNTSEKIINEIKRAFDRGIDLKKGFYDIAKG